MMNEAETHLDLLAQVGKLLLENGAPTYRVAETLQVLARAFDLPRIEVFATATGLILGVEGIDYPLVRVRSVQHIGVNMNVLVAINHLSRQAATGELTSMQIADCLRQLDEQKSVYPNWIVVIGVAVACGAFGLSLGAGWRECVATVIGALLAMIIRLWLHSSRLIPLMVTIAAAFCATTASSLTCRALVCPSPNLAAIAAVLQLVPGVPLVTAIIDLATGDILSGVARGAYGILICFGIALGMLLFLVWGVR
jgi:uncharacterized membrane protein YjjP (DUF1212 family)